MDKLSPMMTHYLSVKEKYKDCIIFYRLGDFYEMFFDDAVKASEILDLTLTGKDCGMAERAPMCGVPFHAADLYISKLVSAGEKVAICEQLSEPNGRDLVVRDVIRVVTAGTIINNELIDEKSNNFLLSIYYNEKVCSASWVDITTGEFYTKDYGAENVLQNLFNDLIKISPAEIIANSKAKEILQDSPYFRQGILPKIQSYLDSEFNIENAKNSIFKQLKVLSLKHFGINDDSDCICSAGALMSYLLDTQKGVLANIDNIKVQNNNEILMLDLNTIRNLELIKTLHDSKRYGSLLWLLDKTKTSMGARKLQGWILSPLNDISKINYRLNAVSAFYNNTLLRTSLTEILSNVKDIGRLAGKVSNGNIQPKDCIALSKSLEVIPNIVFQLSGVDCEYIKDIAGNFDDFSELVSLISKSIFDESIDDNGKESNRFIKDGYNKELDDLRFLFKNGKSAISEIEAEEKEKTGIKNLKIQYNRVFGYYIEVTNSFKDKVPYRYIRRQTLANAERYITDELKTLEEKILSAEEKSTQLESRLFNEIKAYLLSNVDKIKNSSEQIANLDVLLSLSTVARENGYVMPNIVESNMALDIVDGRHPVVEKVTKQRFIPNDCLLDSCENRTMILTGPNMAGKSTYMRQNALIVIMAHIGSFVPAKSAQIPITDKIFTRIGASDSLITDRSTFMVEMSETADILNNATEKSFIILDEIGRGTSTYDGLSIAWAVIEYITKTIKAKTLFATHYHELTELEGILDGVKNYRITVKEMLGEIIFLRKIMRGGANRSFGIEVATLAGVNKEITDRAKEILKTIEKNDTNKKSILTLNEEEKSEKQFTEVERIINDIDVNNLSPMQALSVLSDLSTKLKEGK